MPFISVRYLTFPTIEAVSYTHLDVRTFYEDEQGQMWIGSEEGVYISHHDSIQRWNVPAVSYTHLCHKPSN